MDQMVSSRYSITRIVDIYMKIKEVVIENGFAGEIDWQREIRLSQIMECDLLREAAWVILSSGMREIVIRRKFPRISRAFFQWESAEKIVNNRESCAEEALRFFRHRKKIDAIIQVCVHVFENGFDTVRRKIQGEGIEYIMRLPYMGPATSYHFAKNLGLPVAKPDRHLMRIAETLGYSSPQLMCDDIAVETGEKTSVIDLILWRFATSTSDYLSYFRDSL